MVCGGEVNGKGYTPRSLAPPGRPAGSTRPQRSPTPRLQEEAEAPTPYLPAGPPVQADGTAAPHRPVTSRDAVGTPAPPQSAPRPQESATAAAGLRGAPESQLPGRSPSSLTAVGLHLPSIAMMCSPWTAPNG